MYMCITQAFIVCITVLYHATFGLYIISACTVATGNLKEDVGLIEKGITKNLVAQWRQIEMERSERASGRSRGFNDIDLQEVYLIPLVLMWQIDSFNL